MYNFLVFIKRLAAVNRKDTISMKSYYRIMAGTVSIGIFTLFSLTR
jgi:hypothetical protein